QRVARNAAAEQRVRRAALDRPLLDLAVRLLHVDVDPRMRVDQIDLGDRPLQLYWLARVELRGERMVRARRRCGQRDSKNSNECSADAHERVLLRTWRAD